MLAGCFNFYAASASARCCGPRRRTTSAFIRVSEAEVEPPVDVLPPLLEEVLFPIPELDEEEPPPEEEDVPVSVSSLGRSSY
jgi:hypothetical protein